MFDWFKKAHRIDPDPDPDVQERIVNDVKRDRLLSTLRTQLFISYELKDILEEMKTAGVRSNTKGYKIVAEHLERINAQSEQTRNDIRVTFGEELLGSIDSVE